MNHAQKLGQISCCIKLWLNSRWLESVTSNRHVLCVLLALWGLKKVFLNPKVSAQSCLSSSVRIWAEKETQTDFQSHAETNSRDTSRFSDLRTGALSLNLKLIRAHTRTRTHTHTHSHPTKYDSVSTIPLKDKYRPSRQERTMNEMHDGSFYKGSFITDHFQ